ncbi:hypothetical protein [Listeria ilorinensis]|uniref:hypothetical protein n=1 Tax=Listeria ilorinensis TaxID=2867439 RepID=UPI001EF43285|nr:hypothetical protein [Listeria ilorinensis]
MKINLTEEQVKEIFGNLFLINFKVNENYQTKEVESVTFNVAGDNPGLRDGSYPIKIETNQRPNIKPFGRIKMIGAVYAPRVQSGAIDGGNGQRASAWGKIVENFEAKDILPASPADQIANADGERVVKK